MKCGTADYYFGFADPLLGKPCEKHDNHYSTGDVSRMNADLQFGFDVFLYTLWVPVFIGVLSFLLVRIFGGRYYEKDNNKRK